MVASFFSLFSFLHNTHTRNEEDLWIKEKKIEIYNLFFI